MFFKAKDSDSPRRGIRPNIYFWTFTIRAFQPSLRNLAAATSRKISVQGFPRRVKQTYFNQCFIAGRVRKGKNNPFSRHAMARGGCGAAANER
jgi:hypothetical protein